MTARLTGGCGEFKFLYMEGIFDNFYIQRHFPAGEVSCRSLTED